MAIGYFVRWNGEYATPAQTMKKLLILPFLSLLSVVPASAQTRITLSNVIAVDGRDTLRGHDAIIQLNGAEGGGDALILATGDVSAKLHAKVSSHNVRRSSMKDSAVNLILEIALKAGRDKDSKRVEKIFYMDQSRTGTVTQRFNFKQGINMRPVTLSFNVAVE
jgi:hypothetical protein